MNSIFNNGGKGLCFICNAPAVPGGITCSADCHEKLIKFFEDKFGKVKKVVDLTTDIEYKIPTRDIIEHGLKWEDLPKYPAWDDKDN